METLSILSKMTQQQMSDLEGQDGPEYEDMSTQELTKELHLLQAHAARYYPNRHLQDTQGNYFELMNDTLINFIMCLYQILDCPRFKQSKHKCPNHGKLSIALYTDIPDHHHKTIPYGCFDKHDNDKWTRRYFVDKDKKTSTQFFTNIDYKIIEKLYHPSNFKTKECMEYKKYGVCNRGLICWYYHSQKDRRLTSANVPAITHSPNDSLNWQSKPPKVYSDWINTMYDIATITQEIAKRPVCLYCIWLNLMTH